MSRGRLIMVIASAIILLGSACSSGAENGQDSGSDQPEGSDTADQVAEPPADDSADSDSATVTVDIPPPVEEIDPTAAPGFYVSPAGDDSNSGLSPDDAFATVNHGAAQLTPGTTLYLLDGVYQEDARSDSGIIVETSGEAGAWVTITAYPGARPVIRAVHKNGILIQAASYVEISHLILEGSVDEGLVGQGRYAGAGINADGIFSVPADNHHIRVIGNTISGFGAGGIPITGPSHVEIRDNIIFEVAEVEPTQHSGISILESKNAGFPDDENGYSNYITGNVVYSVENKVPDRNGVFTDGNCVIMDRTVINDYTGRTLIANNLCLDNGGRGIQIYQSAHVDVVNNTLYQNLQTPEIASRGGDLGAFESNDVVFANNLVFAEDGLFPARAFGSNGIEFVNNLYQGSRPGNYDGAVNSGEIVKTKGEETLVADPGGVTEARSYDLIAGSAAIDAGTDRFLNVVDRDFAGRKRSIGSAPDIGAFEFPG